MLESLVGEQRAEELMGSFAEEYFEKGRVRGRVEGRAEGRAESVLRILSARSVNVDSDARQRILSCTDLATLDLWLKRAVTATHISEVLDGISQ
jgi:predicted transposase YdaD